VTPALSVENLAALDDRSARTAATGMLVEQILSAPAFQPLYPGRIAAAPGPQDTAWIDRLASAALQLWMSSSGIGWVPEDLSYTNYASVVSALLLPDDAGHQASAEALYRWALPSHCHDDGNILLAYLVDTSRHWGDELADYVMEQKFLAATKALPDTRRTEQIVCLLGKLSWLAPQRIVEVKRAVGVVPQSGERDLDTGFRFLPADLLARINPAIAEALHPLLNDGTVSSLCGFTLASTLSGESALVEAEPPITRLTETVLRERFAELSEPEQQMLAGALIHTLPLLRKAIGEFVDPVIKRLAEKQGGDQ
jgi:hypothetical protein